MDKVNNVNIDIADNGYIVSISSRDNYGNYQNSRQVFLDRKDMYEYLTEQGL